VAEVNDARCRRDRFLEARGDLVEGARRRRDRNLRQPDPVAADALAPCLQPARVILVRRQHFVARLQVQAELGNLERLAGVARDGEFLGIAAELGRQTLPHRFDGRLEDLPHVIDGRLVRDVQVALQRLVDHARAGTHAAVVQVDDRAMSVNAC
jgi:hypothetical protein